MITLVRKKISDGGWGVTKDRVEIVRLKANVEVKFWDHPQGNWIAGVRS